MSTIDLKALRAAADACHGWSWPDRCRDENGTHHFGKRNEDGDFYEIGTIDASNYTGDYADDLRVLKFLRLVQPATIKALIDRLEAAEAAQHPSAAPVSGDVALPEPDTSDAITDHYTADQLRTYGQQCSDAGLNAGLDAAYSTYAPTEDEAWSIYNVQGEWGHEPTAKGLFIDGYRAASPKSAIVALRDLVDELLAGDDEGLIQHSDAMQRAIRALKGGE